MNYGYGSSKKMTKKKPMKKKTKIVINTKSKNISSINLEIIEPVPVEENTGLDSRTEQFQGKINNLFQS